MALGFVGRTRHGHHVSEGYCDACATERIYPMLHDTLYKVDGTEIHLCEMHAILARRRPPTPGFEAALLKAQEEAHAARLARNNAALQAAARERARERERLSHEGEQPGGSEDSGGQQSSSVE